MGIQMQSAVKRGDYFTPRYLRRMLGLVLIGLLHAILVFSGDILVLYGVLGALLWYLRNQSPNVLIKTALWMLPLSLLSFIIFSVSVEIAIVKNAAILDELTVDIQSGFFDAAKTRFSIWPAMFLYVLFLQGALVFAAFAVGLAAAKTDFFTDNSSGLRWLKKYLPLLVTIAIPLNLLFGAVMAGFVPEHYEWLTLLGFLGIIVAAPMLSAVYLLLLVQFAKSVSMPELLILAGRNSLSCYVLQGVLAGFVFGAYGLGYFNTFGYAVLLPISISIALAAMVCVGFYAKCFGQGPLEPLLRFISFSKLTLQ